MNIQTRNNEKYISILFILKICYIHFRMKKILIIKNGYFENPNNTYKANRLKEEFSVYGIDTDVVSAIDLLPLCYGDKIVINKLNDYYLGIDLDKDSYLADCLEALNFPLCNSAKSLHLSDDKMSSIIALKGSGINVPLTIPSPLCYVKDIDKNALDSFLNQIEKNLGYPFVFKANHGSMGKQVVLIKNRDELTDIETKNKSLPHLYEKFLSVHQGHDYRIMVVGNKVVACMERINKNDFRSNIALGGTGYDVTDTLSDEFKNVAIKATQILDLDYAGIDVAITNDEKPTFIEANGNAFFTEIEKVTNVNITKLLVEHLISKYNLLK